MELDINQSLTEIVLNLWRMLFRLTCMLPVCRSRTRLLPGQRRRGCTLATVGCGGRCTRPTRRVYRHQYETTLSLRRQLRWNISSAIICLKAALVVGKFRVSA